MNGWIWTAAAIYSVLAWSACFWGAMGLFRRANDELNASIGYGFTWPFAGALLRYVEAWTLLAAPFGLPAAAYVFFCLPHA